MARKFKFQSILGGSGKSDSNSTTTPETSAPIAASPQPAKTDVPDFQVVAGVLKKYNGSDEDIIIPNDMGIKSIGQRAFFKCSSIKTVKMPSTVTSIANYAFSNCENMTHISIPSSVSSIGNYAFENCKSLQGISLPDILSSVGHYLFSGCKSLTSVTLPEGLRAISNYMFYRCESLEEIVIPDKVAGISWKAFSGCTSLKNITFSKRLNTFGNYAFENCSSITELQLPDNLTNIGEGVFFLCENLEKLSIAAGNTAIVIDNGILYNHDKTILYVYPSKLKGDNSFTLPSSVTTISYGAFSNCTDLDDIIIHNKVTTIENYAFYNCTKLKKMSIPSSVTTLGKSAFHKCTNLVEISIPTSINRIESGTFSGCESITSIKLPSGTTHIGELAFFGCESLVSIKFPTSLVSIGRAAFSNCNSLNEINIGDNLTSIDKGVFSHCSSLYSINVSDSNTAYSSIDGVLYNKDKNYIYNYPGGKSDDEYVIPESVTRVLDQAFLGVSNLRKLTLSKSITNIGISAFSECENLEELIIESGVTSIGTFAFSKCPKLSLVTIPDSVTYIDSSAFAECPEITFNCSSSSYALTYANENNIKVNTPVNLVNEPETNKESDKNYQSQKSVISFNNIADEKELTNIKSKHVALHSAPAKAKVQKSTADSEKGLLDALAQIDADVESGKYNSSEHISSDVNNTVDTSVRDSKNDLSNINDDSVSNLSKINTSKNKTDDLKEPANNEVNLSVSDSDKEVILENDNNTNEDTSSKKDVSSDNDTDTKNDISIEKEPNSHETDNSELTDSANELNDSDKVEDKEKTAADKSESSEKKGFLGFRKKKASKKSQESESDTDDDTNNTIMDNYQDQQAMYNIDPQTGYYIDPQTGYYVDPQTGYYVDPQSGYYIDPQTGYYIDPQTGYYVNTSNGYYDQQSMSYDTNYYANSDNNGFYDDNGFYHPYTAADYANMQNASYDANGNILYYDDNTYYPEQPADANAVPYNSVFSEDENFNTSSSAIVDDVSNEEETVSKSEPIENNDLSENKDKSEIKDLSKSKDSPKGKDLSNETLKLNFKEESKTKSDNKEAIKSVSVNNKSKSNIAINNRSDNASPKKESDTLTIDFGEKSSQNNKNDDSRSKSDMIRAALETSEPVSKSAQKLNEKLYNERIKDTSFAGAMRRITNLTTSPNTANSMFLIWDEFPGTTEYHLLKLNPKTNEFDDISKIKSNKSLITGIVPGITEEYKIMAYKLVDSEKVPCASSKSIKISINLPPITGFKCISVTQTTITLAWDEERDALRYKVYAYKQAEKKFLPIEEATKNTITLSGLRGGTTLRLTVVAVKMINRVECETSFSNEVFATTDMAPVSGIIMASHTESTIKLNWISISGVSEYKVYIYNPASDNYEFLKSTKDNFIVIDNLTPNTEYKFRIRACKVISGKEYLGPPSSVAKGDTYM